MSENATENVVTPRSRRSFRIEAFSSCKRGMRGSEAESIRIYRSIPANIATIHTNNIYGNIIELSDSISAVSVVRVKYL